jgi:predicted small lipoprotein YifL
VTRRRLLLLIPALIAVLVVSACGKKGAPKPPDPEKNKLPRQYPKPE